MTLSMQGYRGTRDFFPELQRQRQFLFSTWRHVLESFGYEEYDGPFLEPFELYASKTSEEIVNQQLYSFVDQGDRKLAIRPEMTPTLARMVAQKSKEIPKPIRWFSIPTCMRYERPQRGRLREFTQLNVDVFGGTEMDEDLELIQTAVELMRGCKAQDSQFEVRVNHRKLVNAFFEKECKLSSDKVTELIRLMDKRDKMSDEAFIEGCKKLGHSQDLATKISQFLKTSSTENLVSQNWAKDDSSVIYLKSLLGTLNAIYPQVKIVFAPQVMRGFDYYTGMVFEIFDTDPQNARALFGGGRYEDLVGSFGVDPLPGVGYGVSDVSLLNFMEVHGLLSDTQKKVDVALIRFSENDREHVFTLAQKMREKGLKVEATLVNSKFGKQIQAAEKSGAHAVVFMGAEDLAAQTFQVKWLKTGQQQSYALNSLNDFIRSVSSLESA